MAGVSELRSDGVGVTPVDGGLGGAGEEVSGVSGERNGCASAHNLLLSLDLHHLVADLNFSDGAVAGTDKEVTVSEELHAVDALGEKSVSRSDSLEESALEVDFDNIASEGTHVG